MSALVQESYNARYMNASGQLLSASGGALGGFLCTTAGTLKLWANTAASGAVIVDTLTLTAGQYVPMPYAINGPVYAELGGGCVGTFAVN